MVTPRLQAPGNRTQMDLNNDGMNYPSQNTKPRGGGTSDRGLEDSAAPLPLPSLSSGWYKVAAEAPLVSSSHGNIQSKNRNPRAPLLIFHWAELGQMPSPIPITGKGNKITTMDNTSHNLFLAGNGAIFPWVMQGRGEFLDKSGVLLGRKKERRNRMDAGQTASSAHHRELVVEGGGHQRQTIHSTVPLESFPYAF